jgi:hypothetical protein
VGLARLAYTESPDRQTAGHRGCTAAASRAIASDTSTRGGVSSQGCVQRGRVRGANEARCGPGRGSDIAGGAAAAGDADGKPSRGLWGRDGAWGEGRKEDEERGLDGAQSAAMTTIHWMLFRGCRSDKNYLFSSLFLLSLFPPRPPCPLTMLRLGLLSLAASLAAPLASAVQLHRRDAPAVVGFDIQRGQIDGPDPRDLPKRDDQTVRQTLINEVRDPPPQPAFQWLISCLQKSFYFCNVTIGTPGQQLSLVIDTGSSDLWCKSADSAMCSTPPNSCNVTGAFDADESSTLSVVSSQFNITYVDGTSASGDYVTDTLRISEATVEDFQFAVGYEFTSNGRAS